MQKSRFRNWRRRGALIAIGSRHWLAPPACKALWMVTFPRSGTVWRASHRRVDAPNVKGIKGRLVAIMDFLQRQGWSRDKAAHWVAKNIPSELKRRLGPVSAHAVDSWLTDWAASMARRGAPEWRLWRSFNQFDAAAVQILPIFSSSSARSSMRPYRLRHAHPKIMRHHA
jgi:hypothetical protein